MQIEFDLNKQDYIDFNLYHAKTSQAVKKSLFFQRFGPPVLFLVLSFLLEAITVIPLLYWLIAFSVVAVLWILFYPAYLNKILTNRISRMVDEGKNKDLLGRRVMIIDEKGIEGKSENGETRIAWSGVERIVSADHFILIYTSSISAYIIPGRAFATDQDRDAFLEYINRQKSDNPA
jgi:hypothetical protein